MGKRVLLVDDDHDLVDTMAEALEPQGYVVLKAYDGEQGWAMIKEHRPDLIVLDVMMPKKHGYQVAEELKGSEFSEIPVIMLTAVASHVSDTTFSHAQGKALDADDYISKPFRVEDLLASVRRLL